MADVRFTWNGRQVSGEVAQAGAEGLRDAAEHVLEHANRTVPLEESTLEKSGVADVDQAALEATVSYDTPYAVTQHEDRTLQHDEGRRAKWLELTLQERQRPVREHTERKLKDAMRG